MFANYIVRNAVAFICIYWAIVPIAALAESFTECENLEDPLFQDLYQYSIASTQRMGDVLGAIQYELEDVKIYTEQPSKEYFDRIVTGTPLRTIFYVSPHVLAPGDFFEGVLQSDSLTAGYASIKVSSCFGLSSYVNGWKNSSDSLLWERLSIYDTISIELLPDIAYVVHQFAKDEPFIVTAFCKCEDNVYTKTTVLDVSAEDIGYFQALYIDNAWGMENMDIIIYNGRESG